MSHHRHLGIIIDEKLNWSVYIDTILESVGKLCDVFIKLKRLIDRKTLTDTYFAFVRPKLEYACIVWDDCGDTNKARLEDMQLRCARAVTGAKRGTSHQNIYNEICWPLLSERRKNCKLKFMYKVMYHCAPPYLTNLIPNCVRDIVDHNLRNKDDFRNNRPRTEKYKHSIFMDGIRLWNNLPDDVKDLDSFDSFCDKVKPLAKGNELYNGFTREANIAHAQLRMQCSNLNGHLQNLHVIDSPKCSCSYKCEDSNHYLFHCPLYTTERSKMLDTVNEICSGNVDLNLLLHGGQTLDYCQNKTIIESVELYILETKRLL